ncbi:MAG: hypothetical protein JWO92_2525 [Chitinophagaceae bacterium]|nr:hypothetical protein [Chitinophagaceae bacterium]
MIAKIIIRIVGFPFFAALALFASLVLFIKYITNYVIYGGEAISYTHKTNPKTINDVFEKISNPYTQ